MSISNLKTKLENWRDTAELNAQNSSLSSLVSAIVRTSSDIAKASGWALGASGAIAG